MSAPRGRCVAARRRGQAVVRPPSQGRTAGAHARWPTQALRWLRLSAVRGAGNGCRRTHPPPCRADNLNGVPQNKNCTVTVASPSLAVSNNPLFTATAYQGVPLNVVPTDFRSAASNAVNSTIVPPAPPA